MATDSISASYMCLSASSSDHPPANVDANIPLSVQNLLAEYDDLFTQPTDHPPDSLWTDLSMDFITHLPPSAGYTTILVVVDRFSRGAHLASLPPRYTATKVSQVFWTTVGKLHGIPQSIISDRDPIFQSAFWKELFKLQGTKLHFSSAYHPQSDGQTERVNRCIEQFLRSFVHDQPSKWSNILSWAEYHYNTTFQASTGMTPFEVTYGRKPPSLLAYCAGTSAVEAVDHDLRSRDIILSQLRANLSKAQAVMKTQADKHRTDVSFKPSDMVLLRLHPYRQLSVRKDSTHKLGLRYYGPFPVEERVGRVAYRLSLPASSRIHPVFIVHYSNRLWLHNPLRCTHFQIQLLITNPFTSH